MESYYEAGTMEHFGLHGVFHSREAAEAGISEMISRGYRKEDLKIWEMDLQ